MLEHVVGDDYVEFRVLERELVQRRDVELGARAQLSRERDGLRAEIDPAQSVERPALGNPGDEATRAAPRIEKTRAVACQPRPEQRSGCFAHPDLPPVAALDRVQARVVVGRDVSHERSATYGRAGAATRPLSPA